VADLGIESYRIGSVMTRHIEHVRILSQCRELDRLEAVLEMAPASAVKLLDLIDAIEVGSAQLNESPAQDVARRHTADCARLFEFEAYIGDRGLGDTESPGEFRGTERFRRILGQGFEDEERPRYGR
jgi:hypothetical protein